MTKKSLYDIIEKKRTEALKRIKDIYVEESEKRKEELLKDLEVDSYAKKIKSLVSAAHDLATEFRTKVKAAGHDDVVYYREPYRELNNLMSSNLGLEEIMRTNITFNDKILNNLKEILYTQQEEIMTAYSAVLQNVKSCSNAEKALIYLESVGFDVKSIQVEDVKSKVPTALMVQVDTKYLIVK